LDVMAQIPDGVGGVGKKVAVGLGDGKVRFVRLGMNKVVGEVQHDDIEGVTGLAFDVGGRMISGGGQVVKVWSEHIDAEEDDEDEDGAGEKRAADSDADSDDDEDGGDKDESDESDEEEQPRKRRKKRKRGKGPAAASSFSFAGLD